jgi:hypothetical protein
MKNLHLLFIIFFFMISCGEFALEVKEVEEVAEVIETGEEIYDDIVDKEKETPENLNPFIVHDYEVTQPWSLEMTSTSQN